MKKSFIDKIQKDIIVLLRESGGRKPLCLLVKDSCSEISRLAGCWVLEKEPKVKVYIIKGEKIKNSNQNHDVLVIEKDRIFYLIDPTVWQFFKNKKEIFLGIFYTINESLSFLNEMYDGKWDISEKLNKNSCKQKDKWIKIIELNIRESILEIREPKRSEYKEFARVENSEAPQYRAIFTPEECKMLSVGKATERGLISSESKRKYLIATINNKIVGTMRYYLKENGILWISMIQVLPSYQGKGVGSVLLKEIEKIASRLKAKAVALEAQKKAKWAVAFYKANGYKILSQSDIDKKPFTGTLEKPLVKHSYVFGKILK